MSISPILKVIAGWFFAGLILGARFLYIFNPLVGFLTLVMMGIIMFFAPIVHIIVMNVQKSKGDYKSGIVLAFFS